MKNVGNQTVPDLMQHRKRLLYFFIHGDQHHASSEKARRGERFIADGGSNIHTNLLLRLKDKFDVEIFTYKDNYQVRNFFGDCPNVEIREFVTLSGIFKRSFVRIETVLRCVYPAASFLLKSRKDEYKYLITQTDFLPDTFAAYCFKIRNPEARWIASFFLRAPAPWRKDSPYRGRRRLIGFFYWLLQKPSLWIIKKKADKVLVTSEPDVAAFVGRHRGRSDVIVIRGGLDLKESEGYLSGGAAIPVEKRRYDAVFIGRFHPQKGLLELIDVWAGVCAAEPGARLALIGGGDLEREVREKIKALALDDNVELLGYRYGPEKYEIFKQSKIVVHPATYDSGGMAACEAMAWGLPGVSFDLESLKTYYPKGVLKAPCFDLSGFAGNVVGLLRDKGLYERVSGDAVAWAREWDWDKRLGEIFQRIEVD